MYLGAYTRTMTNGRIRLPEEILSRCKGRKLFLSIAPGPYILCLEEDKWKKLENSLDALPSFDVKARIYKRLVLGYCFETTCSLDGTLELPEKLAALAKIDDELLVIGLVNRFELWEKETYRKRGHENNESFLPSELVKTYGHDAKRLMQQIRKSYLSVDIDNLPYESQKSKHLFLCHSFKDKEFVRRLAKDLTKNNVTVWFDEWEMLPGDSLYEKIQKGIIESSWFAIVLSKTSVNSSWCKRELHNAFEEEFNRKKVFVIPILYEECVVPGFLKEKVYVDMTGDNYDKEFKYLMRRFDI